MTVEAARAAMLAEIRPLEAVDLPLGEALGRVLAEDIRAVRDQPPFTNSSMDGWAVRAADVPGRLAIVGESAAGHGFEGRHSPGQAIRIFTGAALPEGADAVVIQEDARRDGEGVEVPAAVVGDNVRHAGRDFRAGDRLLASGLRLDPWRLSLCASAGRDRVAVIRRPRISIVSTGEEVVEAPARPGPWQIYDSGSPGLEAMLKTWGAEVLRVTGVRDRREAVREAIAQAGGDLVVTLGGASVGDHDLVRAAAGDLGLSMKVESVAVRPGKPTFFGTLSDGRPLLGLPGNPASAFVCAELFLRSLVAGLEGRPAGPALRTLPLVAPLPANGPREHWMRARLRTGPDGESVEAFTDQDSSLVRIFSEADALLRRLPGAPALSSGDRVEVLPLLRG
ncbi:MAG: gephyrin-like molybdotransferase Glp [Phenylobacterium sp.]